MLFLLNDVVLKVEGAAIAPALMGRRFAMLPFTFVRQLGCELYAEEPRLQHARPERALRLASLIMTRAPEINAALFAAPKRGCALDEIDVHFAHLEFEVMAQLYSAQKDGCAIAMATERNVWRGLGASFATDRGQGRLASSGGGYDRGATSSSARRDAGTDPADRAGLGGYGAGAA
jgi:hypothetical protein